MRLTDIPAATFLDGSETVLGLKGGAAALFPYAPARTEGLRAALLGDSITGLNSAGSALSARGYFAWANMLCGHGFAFDPANNYGLSGDTLDGFGGNPGMASRVPTIIASGADLCVVLGGTNDVANGNSFSAMQAAMRDKILLPLVSAGVQAVVLPILPRTGLSATQTLVMARFNTWLREFCAGRPDLWTGYPLQGRRPLLVDPCDYVENKTTGAWLSGYDEDGLHPSVRGAFHLGKALADVLGALYPIRPTKTLTVGDVYDAANNPTGNLICSGTTNYGLMAGTGGLLTVNAGLTPTGSVATGWKIFRGFGSSTATLVGAKENPRIDTVGGSGERQRMTVTITGAGSGQDAYSLLMVNSPTVAAGDKLYAECSIEVVGAPVNLQGLNFTLVAGAATGVDCAAGSTGSLPAAFKGVLRTPVITVPAGQTTCYAYVQAILNAATGAGSVDFFVGDFVIRKMI